MDFTKKITIGLKLKLIFGLLLLLATVNAILGVSNIMLVNSDYFHTIEYPNRRYYILYSTAQHVTNMQRIVASVALHSGEWDEQEIFETFRERLDSVVYALRANIFAYNDSINIDPRLTDSERLLNGINMLVLEGYIETYIENVADRIFFVAQTYGREQAIDIVREGAALYETIYSHLSIIYGVYSGRMYTVAEYLNSATILAVWTLVIIAFVCIVAGVLASIIMSKAITQPIKEVVAALDNVSGGNLDVSLGTERTDETGLLIKSAKTMVQTLKALTSDLEHMSNDHDRGEIDTYVESDKYTGVYKDVVQKVNYMVNSHLVTQDKVVEVFTEIAYGNFEAKLEPLPGKKSMLNVAVDTTVESRKASDQAKMLAEEANKSKSNFLAMMSHEIRTPLNAIIGTAQIQLQKENLPRDFIDALSRIYDSGDSLLRIIDDILDMSKIEVGKFELMPIEYDVAMLINDTIRLNVVRIGEKPIKFLLNVSSDLPAKLWGDDLRIKQILNNLLSNAIKYTQHGFIKLSIDHLQNGDNFALRFTVSDTGQGMKPVDVDRLFLAYSRFNSQTNRSTEGTGLGMNIVQKLVDIMGGKIEVESEYGKGSTFVVVVEQKPIAPYAVIGTEMAKKLCDFTFTDDSKMKNFHITRKPMPHGKVLIVDDTETNLYVAQGLLEPYDLQIETAASGYEALEKIRHGKLYDIIFMDHMMPHMDGIETTQKLRSLGYTRTIIALTANAIVGNSEIFTQNGFDYFISKPIDISILDGALNKFIDNTQLDSNGPKGETTQADPKMIKLFIKDAKKAIETLRKTLFEGDLKLFATTAHSMRSALQNIGQDAQKPHALEQAAQNADIDYIKANTEEFIKTLETIIKENETHQPNNVIPQETQQENVFLLEQLAVIKEACDNYDDTAAYSALDLLAKKSFNKETADALEDIRDSLFLHSDFEKAAEMADNLATRR